MTRKGLIHRKTTNQRRSHRQDRSAYTTRTRAHKYFLRRTWHKVNSFSINDYETQREDTLTDIKKIQFYSRISEGGCQLSFLRSWLCKAGTQYFYLVFKRSFQSLLLIFRTWEKIGKKWKWKRVMLIKISIDYISSYFTITTFSCYTIRPSLCSCTFWRRRKMLLVLTKKGIHIDEKIITKTPTVSLDERAKANITLSSFLMVYHPSWVI